MRHTQLRAADRGSRPAYPPPLVAVGHGSTDPRAAAAITALASLVCDRARRCGLHGLQARAAFLGHALPSVPDALEALCAQAPGPPPGRPGGGARRVAPPGQHVIVLPLLLTAAYHSDTDLPALLAQASRRMPRLRVSYGEPLGPHPRLLRALERRLGEAGVPSANGGAAGTAVVLAAAGSSRPAANAAVARLASSWRLARGWRCVVPAYASAARPTPAQAVAELLRAGAPRVAVATYLLAPGVFADQVREQSLAAGAQAASAALGAAPEVADVILERYLQAAGAGGTSRVRDSARRC